MRKYWVLATTAALSIALAAHADSHRKPGLWANTVDLHYTKGGPQIPPETLAQMQKMGVQMPGLGGGPHTIQTCLTPEQAAKEDAPSTGNGDCQMQNASWSGSKFSADLVCHGRMNMKGHITAIASGDTAYTATEHMEGNNAAFGGDFVMDNQITGKWLGADCGSVQPYTTH